MLALFLVSGFSVAEAASSGNSVSHPALLSIDSILQTIKSACIGSGGLLDYSKGLYKTLIKLDFAIFAFMAFVGFAEFTQLFSGLIGKMLKYGIVLWIMENWIGGMHFCDAILESFSLGGTALGGNGIGAAMMEKPSELVSMGWNFCCAALNYVFSFKGLADFIAAPITILLKVLAAVLSSIGIVIAFFMIAINIFTTMTEFYLVSAMGLLLIPFAVFDRTEQFAQANFRFVMGIGAKIMCMSSILSIVGNIMKTMQDQPYWSYTADLGIADTFFPVFVAWVFAYVACEVPALAGAMISGSPALTGHNLMGHMVGAAAAIYGVAASGAALAGGAAGGAAAANDAAGGNASFAGKAAGAFKGAFSGFANMGASSMMGKYEAAGTSAYSAATDGYGSFDGGAGYGGNSYAYKSAGDGAPSPFRRPEQEDPDARKKKQIWKGVGSN